MSSGGNIKNKRGFTLVEVLVVTVIMGLVMTAVYSFFIENKKTSATSEEVVDVQQNLRVAIETLANDIRMAGFLIPSDSEPVATTPASLSDTDFLDLNLSTSTGVYARVVSGSVVIAGSSSEVISVDSDMAVNFNTTDGLRVITPTSTDNETDLTASEVTAIDTDTDEITITPGANLSIATGDMFLLLKAADADAFPVQVRYRLVDDPNSDDADIHLLQRSVNNLADPTNPNPFHTVAGYINSVALTYLPSDDEVKAIQILITASTDAKKTGSFGAGVKTRSLQTVVNVKNTSVE